MTPLLTRLLEEALRHELDEYLGFGRYERDGAAKSACQHRSGVWRRSLRTMWGSIQVRVPKLRCGNEERPWQILTRYERSFGPWLDVQLALYVLGLSQGDLQETLHLAFGQVLSRKALEHLTDVAHKDLEAFRQARLEETPPALIVDGVNVKVLCPSGVYRVNQRGQRRAVKRCESRVILAALGVWANRQRYTLHFETVAQETKASGSSSSTTWWPRAWTPPNSNWWWAMDAPAWVRRSVLPSQATSSSSAASSTSCRTWATT